MKLSKCFAGCSMLATLLLAAQTASAVPTTTSFTARISENGEPVNAAITLNFKIYDADSGGALQWEETQTASASNGLVYADMGSMTALDTVVFDGNDRWLEVSVNGTTQMPRLKIGAVPYAIKASDADTVGGRAASSLQERVTSTCNTGFAMSAIAANGTATCSSFLRGSNVQYYLSIAVLTGTISAGSSWEFCGLARVSNVDAGGTCRVQRSAAGAWSLFWSGSAICEMVCLNVF